MSKSIHNVVLASKNIINAATSTISVGAQMVADGTELLNKSVVETPQVCKALLAAPFAAAKGYIMESEGVTSEVAEDRAYRYIRQELSRTIEEVGVGSGKLLADLLKDELGDDSEAVTAKVSKAKA
jgi:hypothetical protein